MNIDSSLSFDAYWEKTQARFQAIARKEWEALADGPFKGTVQIALDEGCVKSIPHHIEVNGLSAQTVAEKIKSLIEGATLVKLCQGYDAQDWGVVQTKVLNRLNSGDYDFSEGTVFCVDVWIGLAS